MRDTVYFLIFDGFADWQAALALCEIRRPGDWRLVTVSHSRQPVLSMAGPQVMPDLRLADVDVERAAMLILPGGHAWTGRHDDDLAITVRRLYEAGVTLAAIDHAVLALARAGLLDQGRHTANGPGQIAMHVPAYRGHAYYQEHDLAVSDRGIITASHLGSVEFAREVIRTLDLYTPLDREHWYRLFKHAVPLPWANGNPVAA